MATFRGGGGSRTVLIRQVTTWRLERLGLKSLTAFHDLTNAFGSVKWIGLWHPCWGRMLLLQDGDHHVSRKGWRHHTQDWEGGLMGDKLVVALFWVAFLPSTIRWQQLVAAEVVESDQLLAWHPWSGARIDLSLSKYADDTSKQIVAEPGEDVMALARRVQCSNDVLDGALTVDGFSQNRCKARASHAPGQQDLWQTVGGRGKVRCSYQAKS